MLAATPVAATAATPVAMATPVASTAATPVAVATPVATMPMATVTEPMLPMAVPLQPGQALVLPTGSLERVFLGLSWKNVPGKTVDLDCSVVGYTGDGARDEQSTVWYGRRHNGSSQQRKGNSIVHTGDVLKGQDDVLKEAQDAERIYVWLNQIPETLMTVAFAADVFTEGLTFADLTSARVRLVNADTGQELASLSLTAEHLGTMSSTRVLLLARLHRVPGAAGIWSLDAAVEARPRTLREETGPQLDMMVATSAPLAPVVAHPAGLPPTQHAQQIAQVVAHSADLPPTQHAQQGGPAPPPDSKARKRALGCPALAIATAAGIGAATAIFMTSESSPLSASMFEPSLFSSGVDFASSALQAVDFGSAADFFVGGIESVGGNVSGLAGSVGGTVGGFAGGVGETVGGFAGGVGEVAGEVAGGVGDAAGDCFSWCGDCWSSAADNLGDLAGNAGAFAGDAGKAMQGFAEGLGERFDL
jgi:stress response protein SCP2